MIKKLLLFVFILAYSISNAQIIGKITDTKGEPLPYVNIYIENTYTGTTSNDDGYYELAVSEKKEYTVVFQFLGFTTEKRTVTISQFPYTININLIEESVSLETVIIDTSEDPAYQIIRNTIAARKENINRIKSYTADFYSKGLWRVKNAPEKILGQEIGDFNGALDSTRTGIIYLSETISEISFQKPDDFKEKILASKVSGDDNGFSFNSAQDANFSFYENTIDLNAEIVSPIAFNTFNYYTFKLEGVFYESSKLINKIKVTPKRPKDRVWTGYIYIVEDDWQLYGVDLATNGDAIQVPFIKNLVFKQNFTFDKENKFWVKLSQTIDFGFGLFGLNGDGRFTAVYNNYNFKPEFIAKTFTNEVLSFASEANKKDSLFWKQTRPVPLTSEEINDYVRKDSIQILRKSKTYLDSIDTKNNKIKLLDIITGYSYVNTYKKWRFNYNGIVSNINFNTIQGWNGSTGLSYFKWYDDDFTKWLSVYSNVSYGVSDDRVRFTGGITKRFNRINRNTISLSGGSMVQQFNASQPISPLINTISSLFFERNYLKAYELTYARIGYSQEVFNGLRLSVNTGYEERKPLFNTSTQVAIRNSGVSYNSNNPLSPTDFTNAAIDEHDIIKTSVTANITFGQKYMMYPNGKYNLGSGKYPSLSITFENGLEASNDDYNFSQIRASLRQRVSLGNKGRFIYNLKGGTFFNSDAISFVDFQHFNGNQTRVGTSSSYTNVFNLLPYYSLSTNKSYFEGHFEHNFKGWVLGKIPGINSLNFNLVAGAHFLSTENNKPYSEISIGIDNLGFGKFRMLRIDYVQSYFNGSSKGAFVFGLKFLNLID